MEQSLGKRIIMHRKRLCMTQDKLAEQLGVTAQAVSKWENDQSCPDITMLPKLAEIFGISTDELLGREPQQEVHQAEVVDDADEENENLNGIHFNTKKGGQWAFTWDSGRKNAIAFAVFVLLVGGLYLADAIMQWEANFWDILWPSFLLVGGIFSLLKRFNFFSICCTLFGGYFLVANLGIWQLDLGKELIFPILLVLFGLGLLADALRKPKKPRFTVTRNGERVADSSQKTKSNCTVNGEYFDCALSFGESTRLITLPRLSGGVVCCSFGELVVDLSGCEEIANNCHIDASCSFGELILKIPAKYRVEPDSNTAFGAFDISGHPDANPVATILLDANVSFGDIEVHYI